MNRISHISKQVINSSLFKSSSIYTIASFSNAVIPFLLLPLLTTHLSPVDYGIITMFTTVQAFIYPILSVNLEGAVARKFYSNDTELSVYIGNCLMIFISTTIILMGLVFVFSDVLESKTEIPRNWILIIPIVSAAQFLSNLSLSLWQVREKAIKYASFQISQSLMNALLTLFFVLILSYNWTGRILAITISVIIFAFLSIIILWRQHDIKFLFNFSYIKHALKYGGGLIPHAIGATLILMTNRLFLTRMISIEESGFYGVANQICAVIGLLTISFNNAFVPWLFKKLTENRHDEKLRIVKLTYLYFILIILIGLTYYLIQPFIFKFFVGTRFHSAFQYCFWITLGFIFQGMYYMVTNYINFAEKTHLQALLTISIGLINIPLNYFLIKYFGAIGAAISFALIFFLFFCFSWVLSSKVYKMPWNLFRF